MALVQGTPFDDILVGTSGDDIYNARGGDDLLFDLGGGDIFYGGRGNDTLILDPEGQLGEHEFLTDAIFDVAIDLGKGQQSDGGVDGDTDTLRGIENYTHVGKFNMTVFGNQGDNVLKTDAGQDVVHGRSGDDIIKAGSGNDTLNGGRGEDRLYGGTGDDFLTGGKHADLFVFKTGWGVDTITDFDAKGNVHDTLNLRGLVTVRGWNDLRNNHLQVDGDDVVIDGGNGSVIVLENVELADLDKGDFFF
ncbi:MAG: hypothetical protein KDK11_01125 [Maritimibacter sp.]|nr:hypothetical protein [Maritimibacter sp.]